MPLERVRHTPPPPPPDGTTAGRPFILVVEDDPAAAAALQEMLLNAHCDVEVVGSGEEALSALTQRFYSLAIVDLALPGIDGRALLERMAENPYWSQIPTIIVSGALAALPGHAAAFLRKPIQAAELVALVERHVRK